MMRFPAVPALMLAVAFASGGCDSPTEPRAHPFAASGLVGLWQGPDTFAVTIVEEGGNLQGCVWIGGQRVEVQGAVEGRTVAMVPRAYLGLPADWHLIAEAESATRLISHRADSTAVYTRTSRDAQSGPTGCYWTAQYSPNSRDTQDA